MRFITFLFSNLLFLFSFSQDLENTLLWKVEKEGGEASYLFGSIHVLPQADFELDDKVVKAINDSDELVLEMDMTDPNLQVKMFRMMSMSDSTTLYQLLTQEELKLLEDKLKSIEGAPTLDAVKGFKPFMIATMMLSEYVGSQPASFEMTLISMAMAREMPVSGLETVEQQMSIFDSIPYESQAEDLMEMVTQGEEMKVLFADMIKQYKNEEINALYRTTEEYMGSDEEMKYLLHSRNQNWVELLEDLFGEKTLFIGVGAAHLGGEEGVIALLRQRGYQVTPIMN